MEPGFRKSVLPSIRAEAATWGNERTSVAVQADDQSNLKPSQPDNGAVDPGLAANDQDVVYDHIRSDVLDAEIDTLFPRIKHYQFGGHTMTGQVQKLDKLSINGTDVKPQVSLLRSEERRVGKECRSRWSPYH